MNAKRKSRRLRGRDAIALKRHRLTEEAREAKVLLLLSLFAAFLVFGMTYTFSGGVYLYYSLAAALIAGAGTYQVARFQRRDRIR